MQQGYSSLSVCMQSARRGHDLVYFLFMARAGLTGKSRPRNDDVVPMRLAQTMVIDRIQLAVYLIVLPGKASPASRKGHKGINFHTTILIISLEYGVIIP